MEDRTGKILQKLLPGQLQKEPLRQREPRLQKGPVAAALPTVQWPAPRRFFFLLIIVWQPEQTNCASLDNGRGDITNLFAHPNAGCNRTELISPLYTSDARIFGWWVCF